MIIFKHVKDIFAYLSKMAENAIPIGFVPTMGALHQGHVSLVQRSKEEKMLTVCSIFLNPTQFNNKSDYELYPVSTDADVEMLALAGCDVLFLPSVDEIYPDGTAKMPSYDFGYLDTILEGANRPGHFRGVGQVVGRLLDVAQPSVLYLGQKDYQQCLVIRQLAELKLLPWLKIEICPTLREADGLAMSSRNRRLTPGQRIVAATIYQCLVSIESKQLAASFKIVQKECEDILRDKGFVPEYVALADARDLRLLDEYTPGTPMVALIAARIGEIRLIDNLILKSL